LPSWEITTWIAVGASALTALLLAACVVLAARLRRGGDPAARSRHSPERAREEVRRERHDEFRLSGGAALPVLDRDGSRLGTLAVFWRRIERELTEEELGRLEGLAAALGPSLRNVFRFEELRRAVDRDAVTGLPGRRSLQEALEVECARARRYTHPLSLLLLRASGEERLRAAAGRLGSDVRTPDRVHHLGDGSFAVVLPESSLVDTERFSRRLRLAIGEGRIPAAFVELRFEDDAVSLLERAEAALAGAEAVAEVERGWSRAVERGGRQG
jgi:GGDEF domain-containing protein